MLSIPKTGGKNQRPKYATLLYHVLHELDISVSEYFYLDMVYQLSRNGWCYKSIENIAKDMNMSKNGVVKLRDRLIDKKIIKKSIKGYVKTTEIYHKVVHEDSEPYHKVTQSYHKVVPTVLQSGTKNNNRITKEYRTGKKGKGYEKAKAMRKTLALKLAT